VDVGKGIVIPRIWLVSIPFTTLFRAGVFPLFGAFIWRLVDAYKAARYRNVRHGIL
jgi:hypothetical protein